MVQYFLSLSHEIYQTAQGPPGMTVRGPPGPPGSPGLGWLDSSFSPSGSCGCNESLLRLYVKDTNPKLIPGPIGPPGPAGPEGPSGLPVRIRSGP